MFLTDRWTNGQTDGRVDRDGVDPLLELLSPKGTQVKDFQWSSLVWVPEDILPSGSILFAIKASKLHKQTREQTSKFVSGGLRVERNTILCQSYDSHVYSDRFTEGPCPLDGFLSGNNANLTRSYLNIIKRYNVDSRNAFKSDRSKNGTNKSKAFISLG